MTDDFKNKLLKYLTGNLIIETGVNEPQFSDVLTDDNSLNTYLASAFVGGYVVKGILQGKNANNEPIGLSIIYGNYSSNTKGFMVILDQGFTPLQTLTKYSTGTDFSPFETLSVGEDSLLFGIDNNGGTKRFILLNNVMAKLPAAASYTAVLRQSYNLPSPSSTYTTYTKVLKASGRGKYLIVGGLTSGAYTNPVATELEIVVGSTNIWTDFTYGSSVKFTPLDAFASWDENGDITFKIGGIQNKSATVWGYFEYSGTYASTTMTQDQIGNDIASIGNADAIYHQSLKLISLTAGYLAYGLYDDDPIYNGVTDYLVSINYTGDTLVPIFSDTYDYTADSFPYMGITLFNVEGEMFFSTSRNEILGGAVAIDVGKIIGANYYSASIYSSTTWDSTSLQLFSVQKQFNLYNYYYQFANDINNIKQVYNVLNYNGLEYSAENTLIANNAILYSPTAVNPICMIFARNLYNKTTNGATTTSTVEIPNNFLNDIYIGYKDLMSETNTQMVDDDELLTKNVYENVLLNFINTIAMKDSNDPLNEVLNNVGAIRLNTAINIDGSYDDAKALKIKRTFSGGATDTFDIPPSQITYVGNVATINLYTYIPAGETLLKIEIMSHDLVTSYQEIDMSNYDSDKFYQITQEVEVI